MAKGEEGRVGRARGLMVKGEEDKFSALQAAKHRRKGKGYMNSLRSGGLVGPEA